MVGIISVVIGVISVAEIIWMVGIISVAVQAPALIQYGCHVEADWLSLLGRTLSLLFGNSGRLKYFYFLQSPYLTQSGWVCVIESGHYFL